MNPTLEFLTKVYETIEQDPDLELIIKMRSLDFILSYLEIMRKDKIPIDPDDTFLCVSHMIYTLVKMRSNESESPKILC